MKQMWTFILSCGLILPLVASNDANCPDGYTTNNNQSCYKLYATPKSQTDALAQCKSDGGFLASVQNAFVNAYVNTVGQKPGVASAWLGIKCMNSSASSCSNTDGTKFGPYSNFYPGNLADLGNCVYMSTSGKTNGYWLSFDCETEFPFICEFEYASQCQPGYTKWNNNCYKFFNASSETDAELQCQTDCGHLVSIHSKQENDFVSYFPNLGNGIDMLRIGLTVNGDDNLWTDQSSLNYTNIGLRNPNIGSCFGLSTITRIVQFGQWMSVNCDVQIPYICKSGRGTCKPAIPTVTPLQCSGVQNFQGAGTIYSPGYPQYFSYCQTCAYIITSDPGTVVAVKFDELRLDTGTILWLHNDVADPLPFATFDQYSKVDPNQFFYSTENEMTVVFASHGGQTNIFKITYKQHAEKMETCPSGYQMMSGNCYKAGTDQRNRTDAASACASIPNGHLATIQNKDVEDFLPSLFWATNSNAFWIGLKCPYVARNGDDTSCVWDDGTPFSYKAWGIYQPTPSYPCAQYIRLYQL